MIMKKPLISIITVCYNEFTTIARTIQSIINQNCDSIEYIIIDGGSTDGTLDIIKRYEKDISYWISESDEGIYDAMNKGIRLANGEWVAFMNANDWYEDDVFERIAHGLYQCSENLVYYKVNRIVDGKKQGYIGISEETNPEKLHFGNIYCHQGLFVRKELFKIIGLYDKKYQYLADFDWILKAHKMGYNPKFVDLCAANFSIGGVSRSEAAREEKYKLIIKHYKNHELFPAELECRRGEVEFDILFRNDILFNDKLIKHHAKYYIWGTGAYSQKCKRMIKDLPIQIVGYIDKYKKTNMLDNIRVYSSEEFFSKCETEKWLNAYVLVASTTYEKEIVEELRNNNFPIQQCITMSDIFKWAYENFEDLIIDEKKISWI